ncbi:hypothetical protein GRAN_1531 [Granulicella sibirica]|uniref:Uncharacterized protein n=2 Tax=Granulicella sibirica TaxID=2479048 RepID=A0A4Q0T9C6_9BACT|nr:hypothetical protein GRAN_1531 [Granulicella sibirica]
MRTMNDLATLLDASLGSLVIEAEALLNIKQAPVRKLTNRQKRQ